MSFHTGAFSKHPMAGEIQKGVVSLKPATYPTAPVLLIMRFRRVDCDSTLSLMDGA